jgi:uncharacterized cupredoxin-like copper-binding protein
MSRVRIVAASFAVVALIGAGGAVGLAQSPSTQPATPPGAAPSCPPAAVTATPPAASPGSSVGPGASIAADASPAAPTDPCAATQVAANLTEMAIALDAQTVPAGPTEFTITNQGTAEHEFVVIATDLAADQLPVAAGIVVLDGLQVVGQALAIQPGTTTTLTVDLAAGPYVIICNIPGHYLAGMHTTLTVQ